MIYDGNGNLLQSTDARGVIKGVVSWTYDALNRKTAEYAAVTGGQSSTNKLASWTYDNSNNAVSGMTYPVGHLTTETSYANGDAYTIQASGFDIFGEPLGDTYTVPSSAGTGLAGSWTFTHTYTSGNGLPYEDTYPSGGGLPAETTGHTYLASPLDLPAGLGGSIAGYAGNPVYDAYGDVTQEQIGENNNGTADFAYITNTVDPWSLRITDSTLTRTVTPATLDDEAYTYDLSGNITRETSTRMGDSSDTETQCFAYDPLDRLIGAWTATDNCAATPSSSDYSMLGDGLGSASEYWTTWNYDDLSRLTSQDDHNPANGGTGTVITDSYDGNGTGQAHTLTGSAATGATSASSTFGYNAAGYMNSRDTPTTGNQALTWNNPGQLTQVTSTTKGTTSYIYDADGNLLLQEDPGSTALYLPGEQLTRDTDGTVTGARIIPLPEGGDAVRTGDGASYYFEIPDLQGTSTIYLNNTAQTPTWRQFTPYGAPRGTAVTWIDNRGFLNQPDDPATGLTDLGARQYDPGVAQFIAPDPLLKPFDPQDLDPYAYAEDNPVTNSDPAGLLIIGCGPSTCEGPGSGGNVGNQGGIPQGGTTSYGTDGGNGEASAAPGTTALPQAVQPVYNTFYQGYSANVDDPYLTRADSQWTFDALHQFCISNQTLCGSTYGKLVGDFGGLATMAAGAAVGFGLVGAGDDELPAGVLRGDQEQAELDAAATKDINALSTEESGGAGGQGVSFIAKSNGEVISVPEGAQGPRSVRSGNGFQFTGGSGGGPLDARVAGVRVMDPVTSGKYLYQNGYVSYFNEVGQSVNPFTGQTIPPSDPFWHWSWGP
jgi:RHS repeat-associated protein